MIVYEVNHEMDKEVEQEYRERLDLHIRQMLGFKGFASVDWYTLISEDNERVVHWTIHYQVESMSDLKSYMDKHAEKMRAEGANRFGDRYSTTRRILNLHQHFE